MARRNHEVLRDNIPGRKRKEKKQTIFWAEMDTEKGLLNGKLSFKALSDGSRHETKGICLYCTVDVRWVSNTTWALKTPFSSTFRTGNKCAIKLWLIAS